jgi:hypothetical protein
MEFGREKMALITGVLVTLFGLYGLVVGKLRYGPGEGSSAEDRELRGIKARAVSAVALVAGVTLFFSPPVGYLLVVMVISLPWLIDR